MKQNILVLLVLLLIAQTYSKPIFDYSKSNVLRLTDFNINDQIHKIRRSTNQVSVVLFYQYEGKNKNMQMQSLKHSLKLMINGLMNIVESSESLPSIATSIMLSVKRKMLLNFQLLRFILPSLCLLQNTMDNLKLNLFRNLQQNISTQMLLKLQILTLRHSQQKTQVFQKFSFSLIKKELQWFIKD